MSMKMIYPYDSFKDDKIIYSKKIDKFDELYINEDYVTITIPSVDPYDIGRRLYYKKAFTFKPGATIIVGCNGSGKSTLLYFLKEAIHKYRTYISYDDIHDGRSHSLDASVFYNDYEGLARKWSLSEGEHIVDNFIDYAHKLKQFIAKHSDEVKELFFFIDGVDSGTDINSIDFIKEVIFPDIISVTNSVGVTLYIICTANNYELARNMNCMEVYNGKYRKFTDYEDYRNYILKTYQYKIKDRKNK